MRIVGQRSPLVTSAAGALLVLAATACDSTSPPKASSIVSAGGATIGIVAQPLDPSPSIEIRDESGNRMSGVAFTVSVVSGGGTVAGSPLKTAGDGPTSIGTWTLGTTAGAQTLRIETAGVSPLTISATAQAGPAANTSSGGGPLTATGMVGAAAVIQPSIRVEDAFGNPVAGLTISVTVTGGGSVATPSPVTNANGVASAGAWTLGTVAGEQTVRMSAGPTAPVVTFRTQVEPGAPASAIPAVAQTVEATPGQTVPLTPSIRVVDQFGNGIAGIPVSSVASAGGTITTPNSVTNASGTASAGLWTIGPAEGQYTVTMTAAAFAPVVFTATAAAPRFNVEVRYIGAPPSAAIQAAFNAARTRVEQVVTADIPSFAVNNLNYATVCQLPGAPVVNEVIDDLVIFVAISTIDGPGGTLGSAGPCLLRGNSGLPFLGDMILDVADLNVMVANGTIGDVILHEMLHVLGIGTLWGPPPSFGVFNLITGFGGGDPQYTGTNARAAYTAAGGPAGNPNVPVENVGGAGTRDSHWRESRFGTELMTGFVSPPGVANPLSAISIGALTDYGYGTNPLAADAYVVFPGPERSALRDGLEVPLREELRLPMYRVDESGRFYMLRMSRGPE